MKNEFKKIKLGNLKQSPPNPRKFNPYTISIIEWIKESLKDVVSQSMEEWLDGFYRDLNPEKEIMLWGYVTKMYDKYSKKYNADEKLKNEIFSVILFSIDGNELNDVDKNIRKQLNEKQTEEIYSDLIYGISS